MQKHILIFSILLFLFGNLSFAQEIIIPVSGSLSAGMKKNKQNPPRKSTDTVELPFTDDFSYQGPAPIPELWANQDVTINTNRAEAPPTWGMASFDALDQTGDFYENADYEYSHIADKLTSLPINLELTPGDNVYLSFFFAAKGYGDAPEASDSLILEFFDTEIQQWETVWFTEGTTNTDFQYIILPITETKWLKNGFQFRFKNYVSLGSAVYPDLAINVDHWHIDYIYLDKNRNADDDSFQDLAFTKALNSVITPYSSMPWGHFLTNPEKFTSPQIQVSYKNNDNSFRLIDSLKLSISEYPSGDNTQVINAGSYNVPGYTRGELPIPTGFSFADNGEEQMTFELKARLVTADFDFERNNSISRIHTFADYYAYDDGTAEAGYGLYGSGTKYGRIAYKFYAEKPMTVNSVNMYFNRSLNDEGQDYFRLNIWEQAESGFPESEPLFSQEGVRPEYADELNKFHNYPLDEPVFVDDTFYVGWTQTQAEMLNVGFDFNTKANQHLFYNISGEWIPSQIEGAVMIRPVITDAEQKNAPEKTIKSVRINPNPAIDEITVFLPPEVVSEMVSYDIYNTTGQLVKSDRSSRKKIFIRELGRGIYFIRVKDNKGISYNGKFIVTK
ncbi:MAG: T9SS type A sorting domain-containing protein [Bacteroidota bacterium]|nr:T9SS type A sorting domain-containing protein [Bacteroidota bacterium]